MDSKKIADASFKLASELESDLCEWGRKWLVDFNARKTELVSFDWSNDWMGLFLRKNHLLRCWGFLSLLNWTGALILYLLY